MALHGDEQYDMILNKILPYDTTQYDTETLPNSTCIANQAGMDRNQLAACSHHQ